MRIALLLLLALTLLFLSAGCGQPDVQMPDNPTPAPKEAPGSMSGEESGVPP